MRPDSGTLDVYQVDSPGARVFLLLTEYQLGLHSQ